MLIRNNPLLHLIETKGLAQLFFEFLEPSEIYMLAELAKVFEEQTQQTRYAEPLLRIQQISAYFAEIKRNKIANESKLKKKLKQVSARVAQSFKKTTKTSTVLDEKSESKMGVKEEFQVVVSNTSKPLKKYLRNLSNIPRAEALEKFQLLLPLLRPKSIKNLFQNYFNLQLNHWEFSFDTNIIFSFLPVSKPIITSSNPDIFVSALKSIRMDAVESMLADHDLKLLNRHHGKIADYFRSWQFTSSNPISFNCADWFDLIVSVYKKSLNQNDFLSKYFDALCNIGSRATGEKNVNLLEAYFDFLSVFANKPKINAKSSKEEIDANEIARNRLIHFLSYNDHRGVNSFFLYAEIVMPKLIKLLNHLLNFDTATSSIVDLMINAKDKLLYGLSKNPQKTMIRAYFELIKNLYNKGAQPEQIFTLISLYFISTAGDLINLGYYFTRWLNDPLLTHEYLTLLQKLLRAGVAADNILHEINTNYKFSPAVNMLACQDTRNDFLRFIKELLVKGANQDSIFELLKEKAVIKQIHRHQKFGDYFAILDSLTISRDKLIDLYTCQFDGVTLGNFIFYTKDFALTQLYIKNLAGLNLTSEILVEKILAAQNIEINFWSIFHAISLYKSAQAKQLFSAFLLQTKLLKDSIFKILSMKNRYSDSVSSTLAYCQDDAVVSFYLETLAKILPANLIHELLISVGKDGNTFGKLICAHHSAKLLHQYIRFIIKLKQQDLSSDKINELLNPVLQAVFSFHTVLKPSHLEHKETTDELMLNKINVAINASQLTDEELENILPASFYAAKKITSAYCQFQEAIDVLCQDYQIACSTTKVAENTLLTLVGVHDQPTFCCFSPCEESLSAYPYSLHIELGFSAEQKKNFVAALNAKWASIAKYVEVGAQQHIFLDINRVNHEILPVNGIFHQYLKVKMQSQPLLLRAYQMLTSPNLKINFDMNANFLNAVFGEYGVLLSAKSNMVEYVLVKAFNITHLLQDAGYYGAGDPTKLADAEALVTFELVMSQAQLQELASNINHYFNTDAARIVQLDALPNRDNKLVRILGISKEIYFSNKLITLFKSTYEKLFYSANPAVQSFFDDCFERAEIISSSFNQTANALVNFDVRHLGTHSSAIASLVRLINEFQQTILEKGRNPTKTTTLLNHLQEATRTSVLITRYGIMGDPRKKLTKMVDEIVHEVQRRYPRV